VFPVAARSKAFSSARRRTGRKKRVSKKESGQKICRIVCRRDPSSCPAKPRNRLYEDESQVPDTYQRHAQGAPFAAASIDMRTLADSAITSGTTRSK